MIQLRRRFRIKFFGPAFWLAVVGWAGLAVMVVLVDPDVFGGWWHLPIWPAMFLVLAATLRLVLGSWQRGVVFALAMTAYMLFRYLGMGHVLYLILLLGVSASGLVMMGPKRRI